MAKVYTTPEEVGPVPEWKHDESVEIMLSREEAWLRAIVDWCKKQHPDDELAGEELRFPIADGYAIYVVYKSKPLSLIHVPLGDAWSIPSAHERGLNLKDVKEQVKYRKNLDELFGRSK